MKADILFSKVYLFFLLREWQVLTHIFKSFVGTGILGLPSAVMHGGIVVSDSIALVQGWCALHLKRTVRLLDKAWI